MAKKPKLVLAAAELPSTPEIDPVLELQGGRRALSGRIIGRRQREGSSGLSELFVVDAGRPRRVRLAALNFALPDLSEDGRRAILASAGEVIVVWLDEADRQAKVWTGGAPLHDSWQGIMQAIFAGPEHVLLVTGWRTVLMSWASAEQLAPVAVVEPLERCFIGWPALGGRLQVLQSSSQNFLVAVKGGAVHVLKKASKKKETFSVTHGRIFVTAPDRTVVEIKNLEELYAGI